MSRRFGVVCACAVLLTAAGCSFDSFLLPPGQGARPQQVVAGSVNQVSVKLQAALSEEGLAVLAKRQGAEVRLVGKSKAGQAFCLVLRPERVAGKEKTAVVKWEADEAFWQTVLQLLAAQPSAAPDA